MQQTAKYKFVDIYFSEQLTLKDTRNLKLIDIQNLRTKSTYITNEVK